MSQQYFFKLDKLLFDSCLICSNNSYDSSDFSTSVAHLVLFTSKLFFVTIFCCLIQCQELSQHYHLFYLLQLSLPLVCFFTSTFFTFAWTTIFINVFCFNTMTIDWLQSLLLRIIFESYLTCRLHINQTRQRQHYNN